MMKLIFILLTFFLFACSTNTKHDVKNDLKSGIAIETDTNSQNEAQQMATIPLTIYPGEGVNTLKIGSSSDEAVSDFDLVFAVDSGEGIACGSKVSCHNFWKRYSNTDNGLLIEYSSPCYAESTLPRAIKRELIKINIRNNPMASLKNGLKIGTSTFSDVAKIYGPIPNEWKGNSCLEFKNKGISFCFDSQSILSSVEIYQAEN